MVLASIGSTLAPLALLACPVGMGVMMWVMARSGRRRDDGRPQAAAPSVEVLREERRRLDGEIARLEAREGAPGDRR